ncbi:MAG: glycosyltransferase [Verrucomicrobia bacterium]|nr:glycosyltransferase [Verrucomicrobiota bacterium]
MSTLCLETDKIKIAPRATHKKVKKIAVLLPAPHLGGSLRGAKNIAKMIFLGSRFHDEPVDVVFSFCSGAYDAKEQFKDLIEMGIPARETKWRMFSKNEFRATGNFRPIPKELEFNDYVIPEDGANNFCECDFWLLVSDRTSAPLAPIVPYGIVVYDYIQRYIPELCKYYSETSLFYFLANARNASFVITTTPYTKCDAIQYAGIDAQKVLVLPMEFQSPKSQKTSSRVNDRGYIVLATNITVHKNHVRAFNALERYYLEENGKLDLLIVGQHTEMFKDASATNPNQYVRALAEKIQMSPVLKKHCKVLGNLSDAEYYQCLSDAAFLWHPTLIDNGTYCVVEAAYLNTPSLSSDYPGMRFIDERFKLNLLYFDPYNISNMSKKLKEMENTYLERKTFLPPKSFLEKFTAEQLAPEFWNCIRQRLAKSIF